MAITPSDFSKIWASNADTPEYTFTEANYLKGWDFVGNLPPTRAMWNAMQKSTDEKMKYVFDNFGAPLTASTVADMTMQNRVYVYTGSETGYTAGHWYYWNGTAWTDGGVYNATAVVTDTTLTQAGVPADAKATGDAIALKPNVDPTLTISGEAADAKVTGDELKGIKNGENVLVKPGHFTDAQKACNWTAGVRKIIYHADVNILEMEYKETSAGTKTVGVGTGDAGVTDATGMIDISLYPFFYYEVDTNVPAEANACIRINFTTGIGVSSRVLYYMFGNTNKGFVNVPQLIANEGFSPTSYKYARIVSVNSDSYTYSVAPYLNLKYYGMFSVREKNTFNLKDSTDYFDSRIQYLEEEGAKAITSVGEQNLIDETKVLFALLNRNGITENSNVTTATITTDYIEVNNTDEYVLQAYINAYDGEQLCRIAKYNSNKEYVSRTDIRNEYVIVGNKKYLLQKLMFENGVKYIRIGIDSHGYYRAKLERGNAISDWSPGIENIINRKTWNGTTEYPIYGIIHRGCGENQVAPENTIPGFIWGRKNGFKFCETDIRYTSDGVAVLLHDATINRTARNLDGSAISETKSIANMTYAEVLNYDFGIYKGQEYAGTKIPTLEELIVLAKNIGLHVFLELKAFKNIAENIPDIVKMLKSYRMLNHVSWIASNYFWLFDVKKYDPCAHLCILTTDSTFNGSMAAASVLKSESNEVSISILTDFITTERKEAMMDAGISCNAYCPNTVEAMLSVDEFVTCVTSDKLNYEVVRRDYILGELEP